MEYNRIDTPEGTWLGKCPICNFSAEIWRRSADPSSPTETAVCCSNTQQIGPPTENACGCLLYMPPNEFYWGTIKEATAYWNEYGSALRSLRDCPALEATLMVLDVPDRNGVVWPKEELQKIIKTTRLPVFGNITTLRPEDTAHPDAALKVTGLRIEGNKVVANIIVLNTPKGSVIRDIAECDFRVAGTCGTLIPQPDGTKVVKDFILTSVNALPKGEGA